MERLGDERVPVLQQREAGLDVVAFALPDVQGATALEAAEQHADSGLAHLSDAEPLPVLPYVPAPSDTYTQFFDGYFAAGGTDEARIICGFDWPQGCDYWIQVAYCESGLRPWAVGYGGAYVGLFQVWTGHGYGFDWLTDPYNNTLAAWDLSREGTVTSPWPYCQWQ